MVERGRATDEVVEQLLKLLIESWVADRLPVFSAELVERGCQRFGDITATEYAETTPLIGHLGRRFVVGHGGSWSRTGLSAGKSILDRPASAVKGGGKEGICQGG